MLREMEFFITCILCLLFTLAFVKVFHIIARLGSKISSGRLSPGPVALPVVGNLLHLLGDKPFKRLAKLADIHGPIMSLKLGQVTTVVFSSASLAKEALQKYDLTFSDRTVIEAVRVHGHENAGLPWLPVSTEWRIHRKICHLYIFASKRLDANQELRHKKVQALLAFVKENCLAGIPIDIGEAAFRTTVNSLSNTIFSVDLADSSSDSTTAREFKEIIERIMEEASKPNLADYFPLLRKLDPQGIRCRMAVHLGKILELFDQIIKDRLKLRERNNFISSNDLLDKLLDICEDSREDLDRSHIQHLFLALFVAGTDTTSSTIESAMKELLSNSKTLSKAQAELEQTIGRGNQLQESDMARLPYLQAIIKETLRLHPPGPLLLPRKAAEDVEIAGCMVPKDALVLVNAWAIGRDPNIWKDPNSFVPERFLGSEIDVRGQHFELIPFGAGRRMCPGLSLASRLLHLVLGSLINSFDWMLEDGATPESMNMESLRAIATPI